MLGASAKYRLALVAAIFALAGVSCGGSCPAASSPNQSSQWEQELDTRPVLELHPKGSITIKRDVHNVVIGASAASVADAFDRVMRDPRHP